MTGTERYERQTALPGIGQEGQVRLAHAKVLVAGAGGLGSPLCLYLAAAGIGTIGIADFDTVSISNLQRQILYNEADLGKAKADVAASRIKAINSATEVHVHGKITAGNAEAIISGYDIVADGCDNYATRYIINDACMTQKKPFVYGAVCGFEGQVSIFCAGEKPCSYRDLYPNALIRSRQKSNRSGRRHHRLRASLRSHKARMRLRHTANRQIVDDRHSLDGDEFG